MLHLNSAAFFISVNLSYNTSNFTILRIVSLLWLKMNNYEAGSNYSSLKKGQYRSIKEC